jgi:hypothetical protein
MEMTVLWSSFLTVGVGFIGWVLKNYISEFQRLSILLNRTREEIAREYVTKNDLHADMNRILDRIEALDAKLDRMIEGRK